MKAFKKLEILPLNIYEIEIPTKIANKINKKIQEIQWDSPADKNNIITHSISTSSKNIFNIKKEWLFLTKFINKELEEIKKDLDFDQLEKLKVCFMWGNKSENAQWQYGHIHPWSVLSGVLYVQGTSGKTWFSRPNDYHSNMKHFKLTSLDKEDKLNIIYKHTPKINTMVVFPSSLYHSVEQNQENSPRITISFNTFGEGKIGKDPILTGLNLKIV